LFPNPGHTIEMLKERLAETEIQKSQLESRLNQMQQELVRASNREYESASEFAAKNEELVKLRVEKKYLEGELVSFNSTLKTITSENIELASKLALAQSIASDARSSIMELKQEVSRLTVELAKRPSAESLSHHISRSSGVAHQNLQQLQKNAIMAELEATKQQLSNVTSEHAVTLAENRMLVASIEKASSSGLVSEGKVEEMMKSVRERKIDTLREELEELRLFKVEATTQLQAQDALISKFRTVNSSVKGPRHLHNASVVRMNLKSLKSELESFYDIIKDNQTEFLKLSSTLGKDI
jgi:hypothetical protein